MKFFLLKISIINLIIEQTNFTLSFLLIIQKVVKIIPPPISIIAIVIFIISSLNIKNF